MRPRPPQSSSGSSPSRAGYGRDPLGEACVTAFSFAQTGLKGFALVAIVAAYRISRRLPGEPVRRTVFEAYRQGTQARWLIGADWESLLAQPLDSVRAQFAVTSPTRYPRVVSSLKRAMAAMAAAQLQPAAL